jgi:pimeloyl-ACP methyl ester carboxylesterase
VDKPFPAYQGDNPYVFVCYAHNDEDVVYPEIAWLREHGINIWYDEGISAGKVWRRELAEVIQGAAKILYYISNASLQSEHCNREVNYALDKGIEIVPVYMDESELTPELDLALNRVQALHRADDTRYRQHLLEGLGRSTAINAELAETAIDQEIRYCRTSDGVNIAYAETGEGTPIVRSLGWFTHLEFEWSSPLGRSFWQRLSRNHRLIRYDGRGMGLSESTSEFSAETRLKDLEAVVDAVEVDQFALTASSEGSRTALRYTAKHPDRVTRLVLYGSSVFKKPTNDRTKTTGVYLSMVEIGWGKASHRKLFADLFLGLSPSPGEIDYFMELQRCSASQEVATAYFASLAERENGFEVAGQIRTPTLILHRKDDQIVPFQNSRDLAAEIPGARLKPLDGDCHLLLMKSAGSEEYIESIEAFLRDE